MREDRDEGQVTGDEMKKCRFKLCQIKVENRQVVDD